MQRGFDEGFSRGAKYGEVCGVFYADCLLRMEELLSFGKEDLSGDEGIKYFKKELYSILYESFDVTGKEIVGMMSKLRELKNKSDVNSSCLADILEVFENELFSLEHHYDLSIT